MGREDVPEATEPGEGDLLLCLLASEGEGPSTRWRVSPWEQDTGGASGEEPACQCRSWKRRRSDPWVGKIPWRRK